MTQHWPLPVNSTGLLWSYNLEKPTTDPKYWRVHLDWCQINIRMLSNYSPVWILPRIRCSSLNYPCQRTELNVCCFHLFPWSILDLSQGGGIHIRCHMDMYSHCGSRLQPLSNMSEMCRTHLKMYIMYTFTTCIDIYSESLEWCGREPLMQQNDRRSIRRKL